MATLDLTAGALDIVCDAGDDDAFQVPLPADLTGYVWAAPVLAVEGGSLGTIGLTVTTGPNLLVARLSDVLTAAVKAAGGALYLVRCTSPSGDVTTILKGRVTAR